MGWGSVLKDWALNCEIECNPWVDRVRTEVNLRTSSRCLRGLRIVRWCEETPAPSYPRELGVQHSLLTIGSSQLCTAGDGSQEYVHSVWAFPVTPVVEGQAGPRQEMSSWGGGPGMNAGALGPSLPSSPLGAWTPVSLSLGAGRPPEVSFLVLPCSGEGHGAIGSVEFWREQACSWGGSSRRLWISGSSEIRARWHFLAAVRTAQSLTCRWATASQLPSLLPTAQNLFLKKFDLSIVNLQCPVSGAQKVIVTHSHRLSLLQIIFSYKLSQNVESSLCYATGPCWLPFLKFIFNWRIIALCLPYM